jgi:sphingomyelin phosphodiesterase acid-like 3
VKSFRLLPLLALLSIAALPAPAQSPSRAANTVPALLLSDIHLDPFHDPARFAALSTTPVTGWAAILYGPASPNQATDFAHLQETCGARGVDTPPALLQSSLHAARKQQPHPLLVTVSGDLMAHLFDCRFHTLAPTATAAEYSAFAAKTVAFVALQLRETFPDTPIYFALGNNDSGCKDYSEDPNSAFLQADAASFAADADSPTNRAAILHQFPQLGNYTVTLPGPIRDTRLIVLQDIFESSRYTTCNGTPSNDAAAQQIAWLRAQLTAARADHVHVWVMAHVPPGIDAYSTFSNHRDVCARQAPVMFLASDALANTLSEFPDVIRLALFAHSHMDEFRVYRSAAGAATPAGTIPVKLVPSIAPVNGNNPAFTLAEIDPSTATLKDYTVYSATNPTSAANTWDNKNIAWAEEYRFSATYHLPDLSGASLDKLTTSFVDDKSGTTEASRAYQKFFFVGDPGGARSIKASMNAMAMQILWHPYACAIIHADAASFRDCACPAAPQSAP